MGDAAQRGAMLLSPDSTVAGDPGGEARRSLDALPVFEYSMPVNDPKA